MGTPNPPAIATEDENVPIGRGRFFRRKEGEALHPDRETIDDLKRTKKVVGIRVFSAQYQQSPIPEEGNMVKLDWLTCYEHLIPSPHELKEAFVVQCWDCAVKTTQFSDYSACTTWLIDEDRYFLVDVLRERLDLPTLRRRVLDHARFWNADVVIIEDSANGPALAAELELFPSCLRIHLQAPWGDKQFRLSRQSVKFERGLVHIPEQAAWIDEFVGELIAFPHGEHDDQVDSVLQFLEWVDREWDNESSSAEAYILS